MQLDFGQKLAVVTGGTGGIGLYVVKELLACNARVAVIYRSEGSAAKAREELAASDKVGFFRLDMAEVSAMAPCVDSIVAQMGEISYLVQAAGVLAGKPGLDITPEDWDSCMAVNARGAFFLMQQVVGRSMRKAGGSIVNITSMAAIRGMVPPIQGAHYGASKAALNAVTMQAAVEWAEWNIRCNCVAPGGVKVGPMAGLPKEQLPPPMVANIPQRDLVDPACLAQTVLYLLSDMSSNVTGQCLVIDGGATACGY